MKNTKIQKQTSDMRTAVLTAIVFATLTLSSAFAQGLNAISNSAKFHLVRSPGLANFPRVAPNAQGTVKIHSIGPVEIMQVNVSGLPPNTDFDFFVIQVPNLPFGLSWYQGDIQTDSNGDGSREFIGRFSIETFIVAPGVAPAPADPFHQPGSIPDATQNPQTNPVQLFHLGLWFNNPADVVKAGGPNTMTPFNGEHNAGIQVLNTSNFPDSNGPLEKVQ
jgi:hypothetical protein